MDIQIVIAGAAGEGIQTVGALLAKVLQEDGHAVFTWQEFESRIRGGQNSFRLRVGDRHRNAPREQADILLCMNPGAAAKYGSLLGENGILVAAGSGAEKDDAAMDFRKISKDAFDAEIYANTVAVGVVCGMLGIGMGAVRPVIWEMFRKKGDKVAADNLRAAELGHERAGKRCADKCPWRLNRENAQPYLLPGHEAVALAAAYAGCGFMAAYPMSPATGIITYLNRHQEDLGVFTEQAEDEIAAVNMAIGAGYAGVRAMTATSGGGFSLMVEALSLAGMVETPVVIVLAQRPGPATGLPTRTAQEDLLFAIHAGHGEFPRLVFAPSDAADAFCKTVRAFNLSEKYQVPAIVLTDQFLADAAYGYADLDLATDRAVYHAPAKNVSDPYQRYDLSAEGGLSPRLFPGRGPQLVPADSDAHDPRGHITEALQEVAAKMTAKRLQKHRGLRREIHLPEQRNVEGADIVLLGWGTTREAIVESMPMLARAGKQVGMVHFTEMWPLPAVSFPEDKRYIVVESNATGQLQRLLGAQYGLQVSGHVRKWDGLPITAEFICNEVAGNEDDSV